MKDSFYYFNWFWGLGVIEIFLLRNIYWYGFIIIVVLRIVVLFKEVMVRIGYEILKLIFGVIL